MTYIPDQYMHTRRELLLYQIPTALPAKRNTIIWGYCIVHSVN